MTYTLRQSQTPTITSGSAYASGNIVGGLLTFSGLTNAGQGGVLETVILRDKAGNSVNYDFFLFDAAPTTQTDKTAAAFTSADLLKCIGTVPLAGIVLGASATQGIITVSGLGLGFALQPGLTSGGFTSGSLTPALYAYLVTRGTPIFSTTSDVSVDIITLPDP